MFSTRTNWDFRSSELFALVQQKRVQGEEIIDLTEANPTRCGFKYDERSIREALAAKESLAYAPDPRGLPSARTAVAEFYRDQGITIDPDWVFLTSSTSEAYSYLFRLLCNVGDSVLLPKPSYPLFDYLCDLNDVAPAHYRLTYDGEWRLNTQRLEQELSRRTRALLLIHPNNPTGSFLKIAERENIEAFASHRNLPLIIDEVFSSYAFSPDARRASSFAGNKEPLTFVLNGLSKLLGLPQMKLAWMVVSGPDAERDDAINRLEIIADTYLSVGTPVQCALPTLLTHAAMMSDQIGSRVRSNYQCIAETVTGSSLSVYHCEGGWNALLRLPATLQDEQWAPALLKEQNVLVHPGRLFDIEQGACVVLSLLPEADIVREGVRRIVQAAQR